MNKINEAINGLTNEIITIGQYDDLISKERNFKEIKCLKCPKCGDPLDYCSGDQRSFFRHSKSGNNHNYCPLYNGQDYNPNLVEVKVRDKLLYELDNNFNFVLRLYKGQWKSAIVFPSFTMEELKTYKNKKVDITFINKGIKLHNLNLDFNSLVPYERQTITISELPKEISLNIYGDSHIDDINLNIDAFKPEFQLYKYLVDKEYISDETGEVDLSDLDIFTCKKVSGKIHLGTHYLKFITKYSSEELLVKLKCIKGVKVKKLKLMSTDDFNYDALDIVFDEINEDTISFCKRHFCTLSDKVTNLILWPPVRTVGNYKYFKMKDSRMFLSISNKTEGDHIYNFSSNNVNFRIKTNRSFLFNVKYSDFLIDNVYIASSFKTEEVLKYETKENLHYFKFKNDVLLSEIKGEIIPTSSISYIAIRTKIERRKYIKPIQKGVDKLVRFIEYSNDYVCLTEEEYQMLVNRYGDDEYILGYLNLCKGYKRIKKQALEELRRRYYE